MRQEVLEAGGALRGTRDVRSYLYTSPPQPSPVQWRERVASPLPPIEISELRAAPTHNFMLGLVARHSLGRPGREVGDGSVDAQDSFSQDLVSRGGVHRAVERRVWGGWGRVETASLVRSGKKDRHQFGVYYTRATPLSFLQYDST